MGQPNNTALTRKSDRIQRHRIRRRRWALVVEFESDIRCFLGPLCWPRASRWGNASLGMPVTFHTRRQAREACKLLSSYRGEARVVAVMVTVEREGPT